MVIKESKVNLSVKEKCFALGVNRSSYYKWQNRKPEKIDGYAETEINRLYHKHKGTYGRDRITQAMRNSGITINHKKVYRIMRKLGLKAVIRRKWRVRKYLKENVACNTLNREFKAGEPLKKLVCDITELARVNGKRYYMFSIMDLYSNAIIASNISSHNDWGLVVRGLEKLPYQTAGAMLHSDQGPQFTSLAYRQFAEQKDITLSMSRVGNCYDNAAKESFFGHFKEEFYRYYQSKTQEELYQNINEFIDYYNNGRIQMRFKMSPVEYLNNKKGRRGFLSMST
jgi:transposase InsO family protein